MVRSGLLSVLMILTPAPSGVWVKGSGEEISAPCPETLSADEPARLPRGCQAPQAGVLISRLFFKRNAGELAELRAERDELKRQLTELRAERRQLETDIRGMIAEHELALNALKALCSTEQHCPALKPAAIGAAITLSACAATFATYHFMR
jgi:hypothetical protein